MSELIIKAIEMAAVLEEKGVNFFSKASRRLHKYHDIKLYFETYAKALVGNKHFFNDLLEISKNSGLKTKSDFTYTDFSRLEKMLDDISVVGEHSLPQEILNQAFAYLTESLRLHIALKGHANFEPIFDKIIAENKLVLDLVRKYLHTFTTEYKFDGYQ
ncbi:MAG: hypothetical protein WC313_01555 [Candidatus Kapaibacterium sp.]|jgi:hypothetical protein|nr:hypothetical protein [Candidatus Kapabacteria bacterium]